MFWIVVAVVIVVLTALAWWSSGRAPGRTGSSDVRAEGEAYLQAQHTRNDIGDPFH